jgi:hypothetical protein
MNWKKFFIAFIAAFVFVFLFEWFFHGILMKSAYQETSALWRPEAEFKSHFPVLVLGQLVFVFFFTMIFASGFAGAGVGAGARLGVLVGLLGVGANLIQFAVQPLTVKILFSWAIAGIVEFAIAGAIVGAIYKRASSL